MRDALTAVIELRTAGPEDRDALLAIWSASARRAHPFVPGEGRGERRRMIAERLLPEAETTLAAAGGLAVGFLSIFARAGHDEIAALHVLPERWRQGIGRTLLAAAASRGRVLRAPVFARNAAGSAFWKAQGFSERARGIDGATAELVVTWERRP